MSSASPIARVAANDVRLDQSGEIDSQRLAQVRMEVLRCREDSDRNWDPMSKGQGLKVDLRSRGFG